MTEKERKPRSSGNQMTPKGFALRFAAAVVLVFGTYNPTGVSYVGWLAEMTADHIPLKILVGLLVIVGWVIFLRATARSIGFFGVLLALAIFGVGLWLLIDLHVIATDSTTTITYAVLVIVSLVLTIGMTGSFLWRRLTGQYQVSDGDEGEME